MTGQASEAFQRSTVAAAIEAAATHPFTAGRPPAGDADMCSRCGLGQGFHAHPFTAATLDATECELCGQERTFAPHTIKPRSVAPQPDDEDLAARLEAAGLPAAAAGVRDFDAAMDKVGEVLAGADRIGETRLLDPTNPDVVLRASPAGLERSTDGGLTFEPFERREDDAYMRPRFHARSEATGRCHWCRAARSEEHAPSCLVTALLDLRNEFRVIVSGLEVELRAERVHDTEVVVSIARQLELLAPIARTAREDVNAVQVQARATGAAVTGLVERQERLEDLFAAHREESHQVAIHVPDRAWRENDVEDLIGAAVLVANTEPGSEAHTNALAGLRRITDDLEAGA